MLDLSMCKPCPFCGNDSEQELSMLLTNCSYVCGSDLDMDIHNVTCSCGAVGPEAESKDDAVARWNARAALQDVTE